jgi:hypothetical protein
VRHADGFVEHRRAQRLGQVRGQAAQPVYSRARLANAAHHLQRRQAFGLRQVLGQAAHAPGALPWVGVVGRRPHGLPRRLGPFGFGQAAD